MSYLINVYCILDNDIFRSEYEICFRKRGSSYGNGTYMAVLNPVTKLPVWLYDIRYDINYHENEQIKYICNWACDNWNGKDGAYILKEITIKEIN